MCRRGCTVPGSSGKRKESNKKADPAGSAFFLLGTGGSLPPYYIVITKTFKNSFRYCRAGACSRRWFCHAKPHRHRRLSVCFPSQNPEIVPISGGGSKPPPYVAFRNHQLLDVTTYYNINTFYSADRVKVMTLPSGAVTVSCSPFRAKRYVWNSLSQLLAILMAVSVA